MMRLLLVGLILVSVGPAVATPVAVDSPRWQFVGAPPQVVEYQGKRALSLVGTNANLADANFDTGVIEFDMALPSTKQSFPGVIFRGQDDWNCEHFYLRPHQNGNPDTMQYTPVINGMTAWQIYKQYDITPGTQQAAPPEPLSEFMPGHVRAWFVSAPMTEAAALAAAGANRLKDVAWTRLPVESNGIANLVRVVPWTESAPTVLARVVVRADRARSVAMRFGFSDRVRMYVNGTLLFTGDDSQGSRDYRFLGTIGLYDELQLQLRRGDNDVVFAVSEGGGGWAAQAAFVDMDGLALRQD